MLLKAMHGNLLNLVSTAAHGTKRIDTADLLSLKIILPPIERQESCVNAMNVITQLQKQRVDEQLLYENNFNSLMQRAFKGELNLNPARQVA